MICEDMCLSAYKTKYILHFTTLDNHILHKEVCVSQQQTTQKSVIHVSLTYMCMKSSFINISQSTPYFQILYTLYECLQVADGTWATMV